MPYTPGDTPIYIKAYVFSAGMKLIQFVSSLFCVLCWSTPLGRVSRDFAVGWCLVFKASKSC